MSESAAIPYDERSWRSAERPDLRQGRWTRLGDERILGDEATEAVLGRLAERTRSAAQAQGYATGWAEGHRAALRRGAEEAAAAASAAARREREREDEHQAALASLYRAAAAVTASSAEVAERIGAQAADLAFEVVGVLLGHELAASADPGAAVVARAAAVLPSDPTTRVRMHPDVASSDAAAGLAERGVLLTADASLDVHDVVVETDTAVIDLRLSEAIARLREVLS